MTDGQPSKFEMLIDAAFREAGVEKPQEFMVNLAADQETVVYSAYMGKRADRQVVKRWQPAGALHEYAREIVSDCIARQRWSADIDELTDEVLRNVADATRRHPTVHVHSVSMEQFLNADDPELMTCSRDTVVMAVKIEHLDDRLLPAVQRTDLHVMRDPTKRGPLGANGRAIRAFWSDLARRHRLYDLARQHQINDSAGAGRSPQMVDGVTRRAFEIIGLHGTENMLDLVFGEHLENEHYDRWNRDLGNESLAALFGTDSERERRTLFTFDNGVMSACVVLHDGITVDRNELHFDKVSFPESTLLALPGRCLAAVLEHPLLNGDALITHARTTAKGTTVAFTEPLRPIDDVVPCWKSMLPSEERNRERVQNLLERLRRGPGSDAE